MMNHTYEQEVREAEIAHMFGGVGPTDTNEDVLDAEDVENRRNAIAQELRDCLEILLYLPEMDDGSEANKLNRFSPFLVQVAQELVPMVRRIVTVQELADDLQNELTNVTQGAIDFIGEQGL